MTYNSQLKYLKRHSLKHRCLTSALCTFYLIHYQLAYCDILSQFNVPLLQRHDYAYSQIICTVLLL